MLAGTWQRPVTIGTWAQMHSAPLLPSQSWQVQAGHQTGTVTPLKGAGGAALGADVGG